MGSDHVPSRVHPDYRQTGSTGRGGRWNLARAGHGSILRFTNPTSITDSKIKITQESILISNFCVQPRQARPEKRQIPAAAHNHVFKVKVMVDDFRLCLRRQDLYLSRRVNNTTLPIEHCLLTVHILCPYLVCCIHHTKFSRA